VEQEGLQRLPAAQRLLHPQRELPAADPARAVRRAHYGECARRQSTGSSTKDVSVTLGELASYFPNSGTAPFWITVEQGQVTKIAQQFLP
jgi:hypothetical protein